MRNKIVNLFEYLLVIWIIFEYFTVYMRLLSATDVCIAGVVILLCLLVFSRKRRYSTVLTLSFIMYLLTVLLVSFFNEKRFLLFCLIYLIILPLFYLYFKISYNYGQKGCNTAWLKKYSNVVFIIACISLVFWFGTNIFDVFNPTGIIPNNWGEKVDFLKSYYYVYFETQTVELFGYPLQRNTSIFTEAPVCNLIFCFAFAIELFVLRSKSIIRNIIYITAIITTFSTAGQLFLFVTLLAYILLYMDKESKIRKILVFLIPFILYGIYIVTTLIIEDKSETTSYSKRSEDITWMIKIGLSNPIVGTGILTSKEGVSNSFFHLFAEGGILLLAIYIYYIMVKPIKNYILTKDKRWALLTGLFFFLFIFTVAYYKCLDLAIIAYSMSLSNNEILNYE